MISTRNEELKRKFDEFISQNQNDFVDQKVDYLGINISSDCTNEPVFKIYYNNKSSRTKSHPLIDFLEKKEMIRYLTMVQDKKDPRRLRFDVGLKNRTNENMHEVFAWLSEHTQMFDKNRAEIEKLSSMKVTNLEGYDFAGLYFLGFISVNENISVLKCHYFNRICENPDVLHKNIVFADDYYLAFLSDCGVNEYKEITPFLYKALKYCSGHLWMTGADYSLSSSRKYKIYIKNPVNTYGGLLKTFSDSEYQYLQKQITKVMHWNEQHTEFYCEGKSGRSKDEIKKYARELYPSDRYEYYVGRPLKDYREGYKFEVSCEKSVPVAVQCFLESCSFENCIRNVFFMNGDTDTLGAMAGAIAGSYYRKTGFHEKEILREYLDMELYGYWETIEKNIYFSREEKQHGIF